jgi:ADP-glucose pyrophosphorylase
VCTQACPHTCRYNSHSLNAHLIKTYPIRAFDKGDSFVEVLAADQDCASQGWPQGSAAAVRHFQDTLHLKEVRAAQSPSASLEKQFQV